MAGYHPPKTITSNSAPAITADLSYEVNGKCGCQTIILSDADSVEKEWRQGTASLNSGVEGCVDGSYVYKIVALENTKFRKVVAVNMDNSALDRIFPFSSNGFILKTGSEILAQFQWIEILTGTLILYRDCEQS